MSFGIEHIISGTCLIAGGLYFSVVSRVVKTKLAQWASTSYLIFGILTMVWGTLVILTIPSLAILDEKTILLLRQYNHTVGGINMGILLTLAIAGQLKPSALK